MDLMLFFLYFYPIFPFLSSNTNFGSLKLHLSSFKYSFTLLLNAYSAKPSFFHDENRANLFEVEPESGMLLNTDNGTHLPQASLKKSSYPKPLCRLQSIFSFLFFLILYCFFCFCFF